MIRSGCFGHGGRLVFILLRHILITPVSKLVILAWIRNVQSLLKVEYSNAYTDNTDSQGRQRPKLTRPPTTIQEMVVAR